MKLVPSPGYLRRMREYFAVMLPIPAHLFVAGLTIGGIAAFARVVHTSDRSLFTWPTLVAGWSIFNLFVMMRLMDELKDLDTDRILFPTRPVPAGRVYESDIRITLAGAIAVFLGVNLALGAFWLSALIVFGWLWLMYKWFFIPRLLRANLLLALVTHTPIIGLMLLYGFSVAVLDLDLQPAEIRWPLVLRYVAMVWAAYGAWEVARKTRAATEETDYVTYSRVLGRRGAVAFAATLQLIATAIALDFWRTLHLSPVYPALVLIGLAAMLSADFQFLRLPDRSARNLRPRAELFVLLLLAAQALEFGARAW